MGADSHRGENNVRDDVVDFEEGNDEACQEEENRDVKKGQGGLNCDGHTKASHTFGCGHAHGSRPEIA